MPRKYKFFKKFIQKKGGICTDPNIQDDDRIGSCPVVCDQDHQFNLSPSDLKKGRWCATCLEEQIEQKRREEDQLCIMRLKSAGQGIIDVVGIHPDTASLTNYRKCFCHYDVNIKQRCTQVQIDEIADIDNQVNAIFDLNNPTNRILIVILEKIYDIEDRIGNVESSIRNVDERCDRYRYDSVGYSD